jgi:tetratricopeptide (TPR) repeat protein
MLKIGFIVLLSFLVFSARVQSAASRATSSSDWAHADSLYFHRNVGDNLDQSISLLKAGISEHPDDPKAFWRLGRSLEKLGEKQQDRKEKLADFDEAVDALKRSIELDPNIAEAHFFLGITWGRIGQTRGIFKSLSLVGPIKREMHRTLEIDPKHSGAHHVLGEILRQTPGFAGGSKKGAVQELEKALELGPNYTTVYTDLAEAYLDIHEPEKAKATLEKIFEVKHPDDPAEFEGDLKAAKDMLAKLGSK